VLPFANVAVVGERLLLTYIGRKRTLPRSDWHCYRVQVNRIFETTSGWVNQTKGALMKYQVEKQGTNLRIHIDEVAGQERVLLEAIRRCREGAWACQSGECLNIGAMEERVEDGSVFLTLIPRPGVQIDPAGIEICLRYTLALRENPINE
jgi:hypothetical protein